MKKENLLNLIFTDMPSEKEVFLLSELKFITAEGGKFLLHYCKNTTGQSVDKSLTRNLVMGERPQI